MDKELDKAVELIRRLLKGRVDSFEVFLSSSKGLSVEAKDGKVDALRVTSSRGASIRTIKDGRPGFSFSNVFTEEALKDMAGLALSGSLGATVDGYLAFPSPCPPPPAEPLG
ncbi:MAG TPA: DNA gyrase modulator, partial [Thermodesulfobacteriota bacterium]|nr:DNA gyrase modulator [Thermodesulfobacteriota bacterium]